MGRVLYMQKDIIVFGVTFVTLLTTLINWYKLIVDEYIGHDLNHSVDLLL